MDLTLHQITTAFSYFIYPFILSLIFVPITKKIGLNLGIYAQENARTVHHGKIVRIGGLAIYVAFMLAMIHFLDADRTINAILIGGSIVFMGGLIDDMLDLSPLAKLCFQAVSALVAIFYGQITLSGISVFNISLNMGFISMLVSFVWIVGVTNAINLIDGLDGLSSGVSFITLTTIGFIGYLMGLKYICIICLILMGAILGFLIFNFHPASIFMGDCGALFLGYTIACLSLLGFKTTTFITLGFPVIILFVPISDTLVAMLRRKLSGHKMTDADRSHLHHVLMFKMGLGHRNTVLAIYVVALLFGICAVVSFFDEIGGLIMLGCLLLIYDLFVEYTGMLNSKYRPLLSMIEKITHKRIEKK